MPHEIILRRVALEIATRIDSSATWYQDHWLPVYVTVIVVWALARGSEIAGMERRPGNLPCLSAFHDTARGARSARVGGAPTYKGRTPARRNARVSPSQGNRGA